MIATKPMTIADLDLLDLDMRNDEIIDGVLGQRKTLGKPHWHHGFDLGRHAGNFAASNNLGELYTSDTNFIIAKDPPSLLHPDFAFVRADRLRPEDLHSGYYDMVPDLVVEVVSPRNHHADVAWKVERRQRAGAPLIWVVEPAPQAIVVYADGQEPRSIGIDGRDVFPGFLLPVRNIFR